ncbi:MAG: hypothetical protein H7175_22800, partial [Burkholderiales bacterium]|nr:hypothetical protein [Anaerolineae bacterium]
MNGQSGLSRFVGRLLPRRLFKRGQAGQSIVILALGFMALLGFVGIVTDVSLLFVRYSTLRRSVDSASIAAAGQMRRDRSIANVSLSARQFIEFHGLNPTTVVVNTCQTIPQWPAADRTAIPPNTLTKQPNYDDPEYFRLRGLLECESGSQRKLVHVVAEIESPTIFLRLLGWGSVTLQAEAVAETAVIDVVMVMDVSESMLNETTVETWANTVVNGAPLDQGVVYVPPRVQQIALEKVTDYFDDCTPSATCDPIVDYNHIRDDIWNWMVTHDQYIVNDFMWYDGLDTPPTGPTVWPATASGDDLAFWVGRLTDPADLPYTVDSGNVQTDPREECRVRFYPYSQRMPVPTTPYNYISTSYNPYSPRPDDENGVEMLDQWYPGTTFENSFDGFLPTYDFYGCCNDPDGNFLFTDLICQPFKQARDAAESFIGRLDFMRGDRVGFVTFDRQAYQIDPDGEGPAPVMIEDEEAAFQTLTQL